MVPSTVVSPLAEGDVPLTPRELEVLALLAEGASNKGDRPSAEAPELVRRRRPQAGGARARRYAPAGFLPGHGARGRRPCLSGFRQIRIET